jgi:hypothetical protein
MYELEKLVEDVVKRVNALCEYVGVELPSEEPPTITEEQTDPDA